MISGGVGGGDTRRSVLLRDFHIVSTGKKGVKKQFGRDYVEVSKASVDNSQAREYNFSS